MHRLSALNPILPAAIAAAALCALPAWGATSDTSAHANTKSAASSQPASASQNGAVQNHTQGKVKEDCLREDPRKNPTDVACSKLKSMRQPKQHTASTHSTGSTK
jgi:hypothetical protein